MRRHVIIGRFGANDRTAVPTASDEVSTRLEFVVANRRLEHGIGDALDELAKLKMFPSEIGVDLLVLAAHVHAADTRISRMTESQDAWTREIRLVAPVSDVATWNVNVRLLEQMLDFLTGDRWMIGFRARPAGFECIVPREAGIGPTPFNALSLFSGGLDSLIGAIDILEQGKAPLFISHAGEGATSDSQNTLFRRLKRHYTKSHFDRLRIWMNFPSDLVRNVGIEPSTRGRSFLFFAAGAFAGTGMIESFTLRIPENGLIALNVPLDPLRLGALSTRTTHPFYVARWNDLLNALGIAGHLDNPYWNMTKGEMVASCANQTLLASLIPDSLSCASPAKARWQGRAMEHCGYCLPCIIRRAALKKGLKTADPTDYTVNLHARTLNTLQAEGQQVRAFQYVIERLRLKPQLASLLIHKPGPLSDESAARQAALADVYRRGLEEVASLVADVRTTPG